MEPERISKYRSLVVRAAILAQDRPDLSEAAKRLARKMQRPTEADFGLKRLARYLKGTVRLVQRFAPQKFSDVVTVHAENDFAGTRKSTTGLVCYYGNHEVRHSRLEQPSKHGVCILWRSRVLRSGEGSGQQNGYSRAPAWMGHRR